VTAARDGGGLRSSQLVSAPVLLVCPVCRGPLSGRDSVVECVSCGREYPRIRDLVALVPVLTRQHESQREYFDAEFAAYRTYTIENWRQSFIDRIFAALRLEPGDDRYLDVGVGGSGATVIEAARRGVESWGCDLSLGAISQARAFAETERVADRASFVVSSAESLPFPDASFTAVSAVALLEHLEDDGLAVREIARVTRPGARVWVMVPHAFWYMPPPIWPVYWWHDRRLGHKRHYTSAALGRLFSAAGFAHEETAYSAHPVKLLQHLLERVVPALRRSDSESWWRLERLDRRAAHRPWGALHLSALFRRL
jgi:ubiquinone/menaquinone biosynthesis C-methylase UbiE